MAARANAGRSCCARLSAGPDVSAQPAEIHPLDLVQQMRHVARTLAKPFLLHEKERIPLIQTFERLAPSDNLDDRHSAASMK
jgi:hypothetical protein